jgi:hypothetical protein
MVTHSSSPTWPAAGTEYLAIFDRATSLGGDNMINERELGLHLVPKQFWWLYYPT